MLTVPQIYKCSEQQKRYYQEYLNPLVKNMFNIDGKYQICKKACNIFDDNISTFYELKIDPKYWNLFNQKIVRDVIDSVSEQVGSSSEFIKNCCITENRKIIFPLGYPASYILNAAVIKLAFIKYWESDHYTLHANNHIWVCMVTHFLASKYQQYLFGDSNNYLSLYNDITRKNIVNLDNNRRQNLTFGNNIFLKDQEVIYPIVVDGVDLYNKYFDLTQAMYRYLVMSLGENNIIRSNLFYYDYPYSYLKAYGVNEDYIECKNNIYMARIVNSIYNYIRKYGVATL